MGMGIGWAWAALLASSCDARLSSVATAAQTVQNIELEGSANYTRAAVHARRAGVGRGGRACARRGSALGFVV